MGPHAPPSSKSLPPEGAGPAPDRLRPQAVVIDSNVALDLLVFDDPATEPLRQALSKGTLHWLASLPMRDEFARVLGYPKLAQRLQARAQNASDLVARMERQCTWVPVAPKAGATCKDADDQMFIDLAVAHGAWLFSKDHHVTRMHKRLLALGVRVNPLVQGL